MASGSGTVYIYMGLGGVKHIEEREDHRRRYLEQNPEVRDTGIHLKVDEEQWKITQGSKRQAGGSGPLAHYLSRLRRTDSPHT